ncbi:MAG: GNAT family N-acetyltransferase [Clostridia bacterium]|nr:GNAT family N-acetyltransferase [Clostridia bacterium]
MTGEKDALQETPDLPGASGLEGPALRLEPLEPRHRDGLLEAAGGDAGIFEWLSLELTSPEAVDQFVAEALEARARGVAQPFAVVRKADGKILGSTRYMDIDRRNRTLEIGWTWYAREAWGTRVNPEAKYLLLAHAFEAWGANRVTLKTDVKNLRSQAAIRKLGAQYEGTLRNHRVRRDGTLRDTVIFSILPEEWPRVKEGLLRRLGWGEDGTGPRPEGPPA